MNTVLKVCGATTPREVGLLAAAGADLVGLWHGIPGGPADLPGRQVGALAAAARETGRAQPVLVTFLHGAGALAAVLAESGIGWVQLHAFQPPAAVRALRAAVPGSVRIVKVLHVRDGSCLERPLIPAYERAGTDLFLLDAVTEDGRVGSTGHRLAQEDVIAVADRLTRPFLLAGGITADSRPGYDLVAAHPLFRGIDVDTAARDPHGAFLASSVREIARRWRTREEST
ncbi:N-(5'-phosphoribosyl)anthranilate isomerase [Nonomuraea sp. B12E4]|uniref:phosphoribosylanthranilate isomerase n=1 Tax=Nonomuraea sp. B12E4 TaxID=3153564 RepID=UPI00325E6EFB